MSSSVRILLSSISQASLEQAFSMVVDYANENYIAFESQNLAIDQGVSSQISIALTLEQQRELKHKIKNIKQLNCLMFEAKKLELLKLFVFDMDSTLIQAEVIDELAVYAGVENEVKRITAAAMRGDINFEESFEKRIALLKGINESALNKIATTLPLMPGLVSLFKELHEKNIKTAIISGGFHYFANYLKELLGADYAYANVLNIVDGELTGSYEGDIVGPQRKKVLLQEIAYKESFSLEQCVAIGDGANDLLMLQTAGIGIAFHAKPLLKEKIKNHVNDVSLDVLLGLLENETI